MANFLSVHFAFSLKMQPLNFSNNLDNIDDINRNPLTIKRRPLNTRFVGAYKIASPKKLERCYTVNGIANDTDYNILAGLRLDKMPEHVAIILDGSRRWLKAHNKPLSYEPFFEANVVFADLCIKWGILNATSFVYSLKNLERGQEANDLFFGQLENFLTQNVDKLIRKGIRIRVIGERKVVPQILQCKIREVEEATKECTKLEFNLAICYAGTRDIVQATKNICEKVQNGVIDANAIDEALLETELSTGHSRAPQVDLLIRTGGRLRVSDYLIWQMAQAELYFSHICAPDYSELEFVNALRSFQLGERTFGK